MINEKGVDFAVEMEKKSYDAVWIKGHLSNVQRTFFPLSPCITVFGDGC